MRTLVIMFGAAFITATTQTRALESDVFYINQFAISHSSPVSFSIGYPKGWQVTQYSNSPQGESIAADDGLICIFRHTNYLSTNWISFTIWRSGGATAEEAADSFSASVSKGGPYAVKSSGSVRTSAGDSGWLVECDGNLGLHQIATNGSAAGSPFKAAPTTGQIRAVSHDYFFHCGNKGSIRVTIMTRAADSALRSELDQMVLQTLRFNDA
jgi:hypothetical protein